MGKIPHPDRTTTKPGRIRPGDFQSREEVAFCFKYWALSDKFCATGCDHGYVHKFVERMRDLSAMRMRDLMASPPRSLRFHQITWEETTEKSGFSCLPEHLREMPAYQFSISVNEHGRVHGFVLGNVFHVVWLDRGHNLYS